MTPEDLQQIRQIVEGAVTAVEGRLVQRQEKAVETIAAEISLRAQETSNQLASINQRLELMSITLESLDTRTAIHNKILLDRGKDYAEDRNTVVRLRADLDAALARIKALEDRRQ